MLQFSCAGSYATRTRQPRQVRKEATATGPRGRSRETRYTSLLLSFAISCFQGTLPAASRPDPVVAEVSRDNMLCSEDIRR